MIPAFYAILYTMEAFTVFVFYENIFERKEEPDHWKYRAHAACAVGFIIGYGLNFLDLPVLNAVVFFLICAAVCLIGYEAKLKSAVFMALLLTVVMIFAECVVTFATDAVLKLDLFDIRESEQIQPAEKLLTYFILVSLTKLLFFIIAFVLAKTVLNKNRRRQTDRFIIVLGILPLTTVLVFYYLMYFDMQCDISVFNYNTLILCVVFLILSNVLVFFVYDLAQRTNAAVIQLQLEKQREQTRNEYYELLMSEHENHKILVHDIKRHLSIIEAAAAKGNCSSVTDYIDSIRGQLGMDEAVQYSGNKLIDVIISRYTAVCREKGIHIATETSFSAIELMNDADITSLLDNMFENAVESAEQSVKKEIFFRITAENEHFIIINMANSCDTPPEFKSGVPVTAKKGKNHGIGTKSMMKIVKRYDGEMEWSYDAEKKRFVCEAVIKQ